MVTRIVVGLALGPAFLAALFLLPQDEGAALARRCGAQAMWVADDGALLYTDGFMELVRT